MSLLRKLRAVIATGATWAAVWGVVGAVASPLLRLLAHGPPGHAISDAIMFGVVTAWYGFLAGSIFSGVVMIAGRRRSFEELTPADIGKWGVAASLLLTLPPKFYMVSRRIDGWRAEDAVYLAGSILLSAGCSVGSLLLAKRGAHLDTL